MMCYISVSLYYKVSYRDLASVSVPSGILILRLGLTVVLWVSILVFAFMLCVQTVTRSYLQCNSGLLLAVFFQRLSLLICFDCFDLFK